MAKYFPVNGVQWRISGNSSKSSNINAHGGDLDFPARYWLYFAAVFFLFVGLPAIVDTKTRKDQAKIEQLNAGQEKLTPKQTGQKTLCLHPKMFQNCKNY